MPSLTYDVTVSRDGSLWLLEIPALGGRAEARWLGEAETVARAFVADFEDVDPDDVELDITVEYPGETAKHLDRAEEYRRKAADALDSEWESLSFAARELDAAALTRRDIGDILGLPVQRVRRLLKGSPRPTTAAELAN
ncbi:hypothetical protein [Frondihabitans cladoniiphilus]|uniref:Antitoxin HicB n=1 Tax=Frondihabitans cladoniiphilus TaxID=715785 RepID=A0ABP8VPD5_9MICO